LRSKNLNLTCSDNIAAGEKIVVSENINAVEIKQNLFRRERKVRLSDFSFKL